MLVSLKHHWAKESGTDNGTKATSLLHDCGQHPSGDTRHLQACFAIVFTIVTSPFLAQHLPFEDARTTDRSC